MGILNTRILIIFMQTAHEINLAVRWSNENTLYLK